MRAEVFNNGVNKLIQRAIPGDCKECHPETCKNASCIVPWEADRLFNLKKCPDGCVLYIDNGVCRDASCQFANLIIKKMNEIKNLTNSNGNL